MSHHSMRLSPLAWAVAIAIAVFAVNQSTSWGAAPLAPGGANRRPGLPAPDYTFPSGIPANFSVVAVPLTNVPYVGTFTGFASSEVLRDPNTGNLAFGYRFNNLSPIANEINRVSIDDPSHPWTGVNIFDSGSDASGVSTPVGAGWADGSPYDIERDGIFSSVAAQFSQLGLGTSLESPNQNTSALIWVATNAKRFALTDVSLLDGGPGGTSMVYGPLVPEPTTLLLSVIGCVGGAIMFRRRRQTN